MVFTPPGSPSPLIERGKWTLTRLSLGLAAQIASVNSVQLENASRYIEGARLTGFDENIAVNRLAPALNDDLMPAR